MNKRIVFMVLTMVTFMFSTVFAQENKTENKNAAKLEFDKIVHDYGTVNQGADGSCVFTFKNIGKEPLVLENVRSSCGCTVPEWTKEPINKGKTGTIKVKYNTNIVGNFTKSITVYSNDATSPTVLTIKGVVVKVEEPAQKVE